MAIILFSNNAKATLQSSIGSGATTITLAPGTGAQFPNPSAGQYFLGTLIDAATGLLNEIVQVTARSGDVLTVVRAQEGTAAQNWNAGDFFRNFWTAGSASAMLQQGQQQQQATNYAVDTGSADAIAITLSPAPTSLANVLGAPIRVKVAATNLTVTPTINVNSLGAQNIVTVGPAGAVGVGVSALCAGEIVVLTWDGTNFQMQGPIGAATVAQVKAGTDNLHPITSLSLAGAFAYGGSGGAGGYIYQKFPGGLIIQAGNFQMVGTTLDVTLPVAFPTNSIATVASTDTGGSWTGVQASPKSGSTLTKITLSGWAGNSPVATAVSGAWMAFGF